jgi:hypothetical protein
MLPYHDWATRLGAIKCKLFGKADLGRWADPTQYDDWEERSKMIAEMIPAGARVIEFGAGSRLLERHLDRSCVYVPSDLVSRGPDTIVLDLNKGPLPDFTSYRFDVAVMAGVLEYVSNLRSFVSWLGRQVPTVIASYEVAQGNGGRLKRLAESFSRLGVGWVNSYSEQELVGLFTRAGLPLTGFVDWHGADGDERIFHFERK